MARWLVPDGALVEGGLEPVAVRIDEGRITAIASTPSSDEPVERLSGRLLLPGFVNAHSHAFQRGLRGHVQHRGAAGEADSFWSWRERMYTLATALDPEGIEAVSALAFLEMARAGFTTVGEFHYVQHQPDGTPYADPDELAWRVIAAAERVGIRIVLLRVAYARAGFGVAPNPRQRRFYDRSPDDVLAAVERIGKRVPAGLAPHSTRACPADWLRAFAGFPGVIHAHVDEQPAEIEASLREHGRRPLHVFADAGLVTARFSAVHLTHPDDAEITTLREAGGTVVACPTTELDLGDGFLAAERMEGVRLAIGSDSHALIDPFTELRSVEWHTRARTGHRNVLAHDGADGLATRLLRHGALDGARSLGVDGGEIRVGAPADLVAVEGGVALAAARPLPALVFSGHPGMVRDVWVSGRRIVEAGHHAAEEAVVRAAERVLAAI